MSLTHQYQKIRQQTELLCDNLSAEDSMLQAADFVSPPKWHLAHTTWFFEEMILKKHLDHYQEFHPNFSRLFNSYYNGVGERILRNQRGLISRPALDEVLAYRKHVDNAIELLLTQSRESKVEELLVLGLNHEQQHQELLVTDLKYSFYQNPIYPVYSKKLDWDKLIEEETDDWISVPKGNYSIGFDGTGFCFDNELGKHDIHLEAFEIRASLVKNREYLAFIEDGGYDQFQFWLDEGWYHHQNQKLKAPLYWKRIKETWFHFSLNGLQPVEWDAPISHLTFYEASAFAAWKGMRLPTEFEWEVASTKFNWGRRWEWTNSAYLPYPNFKIAEGAIGEYNGKFMVNQMVLRGSSDATAKNHSRNTYRNFFHPKYAWQYTGLRLAK